MSSNTEGTSGREDRSPFRRPAFVVAAALIVLAVIAGIIVATRHTGGATSGAGASASGGQPSTPTHPAGTTQAASPGATSAGASGCHPTGTDQTVPTSAPAGVSWNIVATVALPSSPADGPGVIDGDVARCYSHTPNGALLAAAQIGVRYLIAPGWLAVVDQQVMPGAGRDTYISERRQPAASGTEPAGSYGQFAGFKFVTYTPANAVVQLVTSFSDGTMQVAVVTVDWSGGDWKLVLQPDGSTSPNAQQISNLDGFIPWAGV
jgi:hypothetical protein